MRMGIWVGGFAYFAPLFAGCVIVLFMIKPLFSRSPASRRERFLEVGKDPLVFALVARIARCIGAPQPRQIAVDCSVNASASFGSWFGVFFGGDLVLTIGAGDVWKIGDALVSRLRAGRAEMPEAPRRE